MPVKFNQYWTVNQDTMSAYEQFLINKYIPGINKLGIHTVAGWSVLIGGYSEIIFEGVTSDLEILEIALRDAKYKALNDQIQNYVKNYKTKVLISTGIKEAYTTEIKKQTLKFTQAYDIISNKREAYDQFVLTSYYPLLEELGIQIASEWEVLIGDGPRIICEGRAEGQNADSLISNLQRDIYSKAKHKLKRFVEHYESRILTFHIHKVKGYKSSSYDIISV